MTRSEVREHIFKLVFRLEFNDAEEMPGQLKNYFLDNGEENLDIKDSKENAPVNIFSHKDEEYIKNKYSDIEKSIPELDTLINSYAKGWDTVRMGKVDLAILRLAVYEVVYDDSIPTGVAIDEAVELAKKYGQDESASFINGILASVVKGISKQ
ncbi:MAG: transcription antitermination factor NusB [Lachnospiraceae bacterium]|nr:transcription antitermination factor NusB [Lachnospiraceae bacterium]